MSPKSIRLINKCASLRHNPRQNRNMERGLIKYVQKSLMLEYCRQAKKSTTAIGGFLEPLAGDIELRRTYALLKRWYRHTSAQAPNPYQTNVEKVSFFLQTLYKREEPSTHVIALETHMGLFQVNDATALEAEV